MEENADPLNTSEKKILRSSLEKASLLLAKILRGHREGGDDIRRMAENIETRRLAREADQRAAADALLRDAMGGPTGTP